MDFKELNFAEIDRNLSEQERQEWQAIYASYRSGSVLTGQVVGVDEHEVSYTPEGKRKAEKRLIRCLIVIPYRVKIIIPDVEVFLDFEKPPSLQSMNGANISFIVNEVDRMAGVAIASRREALEQIKRVNARRRLEAGQVVNVDVISVGRGVCTVTYRGYDVMLMQKEVSHNTVPDLRMVLSPGEVKKALVKEFDRKGNILKLSIKDTVPHPFDGVEVRHPVGSTRIARIVGKYGGGVYCRLFDGATEILCSYATMEYDGDYRIGDNVEVLIRKFNYERKLIYGKILRKMHR
jgi:ribosomal protein S1